MASMSPPLDSKKKKEGKAATCRYCDMTFRKLEHAQRHERTHTLDRPYVCDTCGKTFARQDTLHRHTRLHNRTDEDGPTGKAPRKRRTSNAATTAKPIVKPGSETSPGASSSGSASTSSSRSAQQQSILVDGPTPVASTSASTANLFPEMGLSMSLPVAPPSFPAYSQPQLPVFPSIDPSFIPLSRRFSDAGYPATLAAASLGTSAPSASSTAFAGATGTSRPERPSLRPRAMTLAGLPESLGCFSLVNSPASTHASLDEVDDEDDDHSSMSSGDEDEDDSGIKGQSSSTSSDGDMPGGASGEDCSTSWTASFAPPESHYPSPAFSSYSPTQLHADPLSDLHSILENDPVPSSAFQAPSSPPTAQPEFDYATFAASIEGLSKDRRSSSSIPTTLDELLGHSMANATRPGDKASASTSEANRYPTPPSGSLGHLSLPVSGESTVALTAVEASASFDLAAHLSHIMTAESEQLARADHAATAAMFASGFGVTSSGSSRAQHAPQMHPRLSPPTSAASTLSALGLNFGPMPMQASQRNPNLSLPLTSPPLSSSAPAYSTGYALSATFATTYPTLSLPVAGFDRMTTSALKYDTPTIPELSLSLPSASVSTASARPSSAGGADLAESCIDLLARAWEKRQHRQGPAVGASWQGKGPFSHPAQSTPAFYIPASPPTTTSSDARGPW